MATGFEIVIIIIFQLIFHFSRTIGTRHLARDNIGPTILWGLIIQVSWLITTAYGVRAVFELDWLIIFIYLFGGVLGVYLAMKIKIKETTHGQKDTVNCGSEEVR